MSKPEPILTYTKLMDALRAMPDTVGRRLTGWPVGLVVVHPDNVKVLVDDMLGLFVRTDQFESGFGYRDGRDHFRLKPVHVSEMAPRDQIFFIKDIPWFACPKCHNPGKTYWSLPIHGTSTMRMHIRKSPSKDSPTRTIQVWEHQVRCDHCGHRWTMVERYTNVDGSTYMTAEEYYGVGTDESRQGDLSVDGRARPEAPGHSDGHDPGSAPPGSDRQEP